MHPPTRVRLLLIAFTSIACHGGPSPAADAPPASPAQPADPAAEQNPNGTLLLASLDSPAIRSRFLDLAGGDSARIVVILNRIPESADPAAAKANAVKRYKAKQVTAFLASDPADANSKDFLAALHTATGVWFTGGRPDVYTTAYVNAPAHRELAAVLSRGGVLAGESAGAMIHCVTLPLPAPPADPYQGFAFAPELVVFPHFGPAGKFPREHCDRFLAAHPTLTGLCIPDGAAVIVQGEDAEVIGTADVTILQQSKDKHPSATTHAPGDKFKLAMNTR